MANHYLVTSDGDVLTDDAWTVLQVADLPDGLALHHTQLSELLHKEQRLDMLIPLADVLTPTPLTLETLALISQRSSRLGVWADTSILPEQLDLLFNADVRAKNAKAQAKKGITAGLPDSFTVDLVVFYVPAFADGRAFSHATHLRQSGYTGEIRLAGAFGVDQLAYLKRVGVDTFLLDSDTDINTIAKTLHALPTAYRGDDVNKLPMFMD